MNTKVKAIANHLNVIEQAILDVQEWSSVLWVRIRGIGARFVSKKIIKEMDVANQVLEINAQLVRLKKGGSNTVYGTYAKEDGGCIRLNDYTSQLDGLYLNGEATIAKLKNLTPADVAGWCNYLQLHQAFVKGDAPQYIKDYNNTLMTSIAEYI